MMSSSPDRDSSGKPCVRMEAITRTGVKGFKRLDREFQERIVDAIRGEVPLERCPLLGGLERYGVRRFDFSESGRVTFRRIYGRQCILHAGTHTAADGFAKHYEGNIPNHIIPIEESAIMRAKPTANNGNGTQLNGKAGAASKQPVPNVLASEGDLLIQAIQLIADKAMEEKKQQVLGQLEALNALVVGQDSRIHALAQRQEDFLAQDSAKVGEQMRLFRNEISKTGDLAKALGARLGEFESGLTTRLSTADETQQCVVKRLTLIEATQLEVSRRCDKDFTDLSARIAQLADNADNAGKPDKLEEAMQSLERRVQVMEAQLATAVSVAQRLSDLEAHEESSRARANGLDAELRSLAESLARLNATTSVKRPGVISSIIGLFRRA